MKTINKNDSIMRVLLYGIIIGPATMLVFSALLSFIALKASSPTRSIFPLALVAVFMGGFISSFYSARTYKEKPLRAGLLTGVANLVIIIIVSLISSSYSGGFWNALLPPAVLIVASFIGTLVALKLRSSTKRRLKKLRKQIR